MDNDTYQHENDVESTSSQESQPSDLAGAKKARGVKQMVAGGIIAAVGVPMMILPGPGVAAIAGGAALMGKGYQNLTGKEVISQETREDPAYQRGQAAGEEWAGRVRDFASNAVVPAAKSAAHGAKGIASIAAQGAAEAAVGAADLAKQGFRVVAGDEVADKAAAVAKEKLSPAARTVGGFASGAYEVVKPAAQKAAHTGGELASAAGKKMTDAARDLLD